MAKQIINVGGTSNDKSGDTLRSGAIKINSNFSELYNEVNNVLDNFQPGSHITLTKTGGVCTINAVIPTYVLPAANSSTLGGVKVDGSSIAISNTGVITAVPYSLPIASVSTVGGVRIDNSSITISNTGVISATVSNITGNAATVTNGVYTTGTYSNPNWITSLAYSKLTGAPALYSLPVASDTVLGGVKVDNYTVTMTDGVISVIQFPTPTASDTVLGLVKVDGNTITITDGVISSASAYTLPVASDTVLGGVKVDNSTITITNGVISASASSSYTLPTASDTVLGGVKVDNSTITITNGVISASAGSGYTLPVASNSVLGGVKVDTTSITIDNGVISSVSSYTLPTASDTVLGGIKLGAGLNINLDGLVSVSSSPVSRTTVTGTTATIPAGDTANLTILGFKGYMLYSIETSSTVGGAWVRVYTDVASRVADVLRAQTADPSTPGVIAEVITTSNSSVVIAPGVFGFNNELIPTNDIELAVTNTNGTPGEFIITLTVLPMES